MSCRTLLQSTAADNFVVMRACADADGDVLLPIERCDQVNKCALVLGGCSSLQFLCSNPLSHRYLCRGFTKSVKTDFRSGKLICLVSRREGQEQVPEIFSFVRCEKHSAIFRPEAKKIEIDKALNLEHYTCNKTSPQTPL